MESLLLVSGWALAQLLPPSGLPGERVTTPSPSRGAWSAPSVLVIPQQGHTSGLPRAVSKAMKEARSVRGICMLIGTGAGRGLMGVASLCPGHWLCHLCLPSPFSRLSPLTNNPVGLSAKGRRCPEVESSPSPRCEVVQGEQIRGAVPISQRGWGGAHTAVHSSCKPSFGTWARNSLSANLRVYFCGQV